LRVFRGDRRAERLFDDFARRWRYVGSIEMIGGEDLALRNVGPVDFVRFLSGALRRQFIRSPGDLAARLEELDDERPDPDGRWRAEHFFCYADSWRPVMRTLATRCDVVLMDLRGFGPANQGCIFELHELVAAVPLDRIALLVDATSDLGLLREVLEAAWAGVRIGSPNAHRAEPSIALLRVEEDDAAAARAIVRALAQAASATPAAQLSSNALATSS
jgi:hypothetical protein